MVKKLVIKESGLERNLDNVGSLVIDNGVREVIDSIYEQADAIKSYAEQLKKWTDNSYISTQEYEGAQYNLKRILGLNYLIGKNAKDLEEFFL